MSASSTRTEFTFTIKHTVDLEFMRNVLITACEGGINYWARVTEYSPTNMFANIVDTEDDNTSWKIGRSTLERGVKRILNPEFNVSSTIREYVHRAVTESDAGHIDSDAADCIVQAGLFNELVYG